MHAFHKALIASVMSSFAHTARDSDTRACARYSRRVYIQPLVSLRFAHCGIVARFRDSLHLNRGSTVSIHLLPQID